MHSMASLLRGLITVKPWKERIPIVSKWCKMAVTQKKGTKINPGQWKHGPKPADPLAVFIFELHLNGFRLIIHRIASPRPSPCVRRLLSGGHEGVVDGAHGRRPLPRHRQGAGACEVGCREDKTGSIKKFRFV